jgi:hypothetical protein
MARKSSTRKSRGIVSRVYSPINHFFQATGESVGAVTNTARNIVRKSINAVNKVGKSFSGHTNQAIRNLTGKRKASRRSTRRNARSTRRRQNH